MPQTKTNTVDTAPLFPAAFVGCCCILLLAAIGLEPGMRTLIREFSKEPIALRKPLQELDVSRLATFRPALGASIFDLEINEFVGTQDFVRISFDDTTGPSDRETQTLLFVTYYSNPRDTVPHTPEVCYRQGGATVNDLRVEPLPIPGLGIDGEGVTAQILELEHNDWHQVLVYLFCSNGRFYDDRLKLRFAMGMPGDKHVYFAKIEVLTSVPPNTDPAKALDRCKRLAAEAIPVLVKDHFPTRDAARHGDVTLSSDSGETDAPA